jgi:hypothetical protein
MSQPFKLAGFLGVAVAVAAAFLVGAVSAKKDDHSAPQTRPAADNPCADFERLRIAFDKLRTELEPLQKLQDELQKATKEENRTDAPAKWVGEVSTMLVQLKKEQEDAKNHLEALKHALASVGLKVSYFDVTIGVGDIGGLQAGKGWDMPAEHLLDPKFPGIAATWYEAYGSPPEVRHFWHIEPFGAGDQIKLRLIGDPAAKARVAIRIFVLHR